MRAGIHRAAAVLTTFGALLVAEAVAAGRGPVAPEHRAKALDGWIGPAGPNVAEVRLLCLGDSLISGVGAATPETSLGWQIATAVLDRAVVSGDHPTGGELRIELRHAGWSGARVRDVVETQLAAAVPFCPTSVVVCVGGNDVAHLTGRRPFCHRYRAVLDGLRQVGVDSDRVVMVGLPDMGVPPRVPQPLRSVLGWRARRFDSAVRGIAGESEARYVDLFAGSSTAFRGDPDRYLCIDRYHPSDAGYRLWATLIAPAAGAALASGHDPS